MKDFNDFQKYFKEYQKRFGLTGYKVYFSCEALNNSFADITIEGQVATVRLNKEESKSPYKHIKTSAKHEAIHLLLHHLAYCGRCRYVQPEEIDDAEEEIVFKLEDLIQD